MDYLYGVWVALLELILENFKWLPLNDYVVFGLQEKTIMSVIDRGQDTKDHNIHNLLKLIEDKLLRTTIFTTYSD